MQLSYHPAPGVDGLPPGIVGYNPGMGRMSRRPAIGELVPGLFSMPENPVLRGLLEAQGRASVNLGALPGMGAIDTNTIVKFAVYGLVAWVAWDFYKSGKKAYRSYGRGRSSSPAPMEGPV